MKKIETYAPGFWGTYESVHSGYHQIDYELEWLEKLAREAGKELPKGAYVVISDFKAFLKEVGETYVEALEKELKGLHQAICVDFISVSSPKEYNFSTDTINIEIYMNDGTDLVTWVVKQIEQPEKWQHFAQWVKENYTSYDGFTSFHTNDATVWLKELAEGDTEHKLGSALHFLMGFEHIEKDIFDGVGTVNEWLNMDTYEDTEYNGDYSLEYNEGYEFHSIDTCEWLKSQGIEF